MHSAYQSIHVGDVAGILANPHALFVDVREPYECATGLPRGAENVPLGSVQEWLEMSSVEPDTPIMFICRSGGRSAAACELASRQGFKQLFNVEGGFLAWDAAQLPLEEGRNN